MIMNHDVYIYIYVYLDLDFEVALGPRYTWQHVHFKVQDEKASRPKETLSVHKEDRACVMHVADLTGGDFPSNKF